MITEIHMPTINYIDLDIIFFKGYDLKDLFKCIFRVSRNVQCSLHQKSKTFSLKYFIPKSAIKFKLTKGVKEKTVFN